MEFEIGIQNQLSWLERTDYVGKVTGSSPVFCTIYKE